MQRELQVMAKEDEHSTNREKYDRQELERI